MKPATTALRTAAALMALSLSAIHAEDAAGDAPASLLPTGAITSPAAESPGIDPVPRPGPAPELEPGSLETARDRGIAYLIESQNPDGSWGGIRRTKGLNIAARVPGAHHAFTAATTSLVIEALCQYPGHSPESEAAIDRAEEWLLEFLPRVRRISEIEIYNNWTHAYSIKAMLLLHHRAAGNGEKQARLKEAVHSQIARLAQNQFLDGGWGYYNFGMTTAISSGASTSFTSATALVALDKARQAGIEIDQNMVDRAVKSILIQRTPDGAFTYSFQHRNHPRVPINRPAGSLGRAPACNAALRVWTGREHISDQDIADWLDRLATRGGWIDIARKTPIPHESHFANSGYFFYYAYYYAAHCIQLLDEELAAPRRNHLLKALLDLQESDGSWWDYPLYDYHQAYGTAYALTAIARMAPPAGNARP